MAHREREAVSHKVRLNADSYLTQHGGVDKLQHKVMDTLVDGDVKLNNVNYDLDPLLFFPYVSLPSILRIAGQTPLETLEDIVKSCGKSLYVNGKWRILARPGITSEECTADFFNAILQTACDWKSEKMPKMPESDEKFETMWRAHSTILIQGIRKPDIILVPNSCYSSPVTFGQVNSYCELKYSFSRSLQSDALWQLTEIAGFACAAQVDRRFFVASSLCDRMFTLGFFVRGCTVFSAAFDIDENPLRFVTMILGLSASDALWNGFDPNMRRTGGGPLTIRRLGPNIKEVVLDDLLLYSAKALHGRGTKVPHCTAKFDYGRGIPNLNCILKVSWLPMDSKGRSVTTDIEIYLRMEERALHLKPLTGKEDDLFGERDLYGVFRDCIKPVRHEAFENTWDYVKHLPGIPVVLPAECSRPQVINPRPDGELYDSGYYPADYDGLKDRRPDTTNNIIERFNVPVRDTGGQKLYVPLFVEYRECIRALSRTCGTSMVWFSCRRELVKIIMGALAGHFNGLRMDLLHCDISDSNVWIEVEGPEAKFVVPDWPKDQKAHPKRAGMLGDWGYAADLREKGSEPGRITGTFPFMAVELLCDKPTLKHTIQHDLESFFWLLWIVCVNLNGPFYTRRIWQDEQVAGKADTPAMPTTSVPPLSLIPDIVSMPPPTTVPDSQEPINLIRGQPSEYNHQIPDTFLRLPFDEPVENAPPIWATPGVHRQSLRDVHWSKSQIRRDAFLNSVSPYFRDCKGFMDGLGKLFKYFGEDHPEEITHVAFYDILKDIYDSIDPTQDRTSKNDIEDARKRYRTLKTRGGDQGISISVLDEVYIKAATSISKRRSAEQSGRSSKRPHTSPITSKSKK